VGLVDGGVYRKVGDGVGERRAGAWRLSRWGVGATLRVGEGSGESVLRGCSGPGDNADLDAAGPI
jgi:hypothetical protein